MSYKNCPNCGAPVKSFQCEYCGTLFQDKRNEIKMLADEIQKLMFEDSLVNDRQQTIDRLQRNRLR